MRGEGVCGEGGEGGEGGGGKRGGEAGPCPLREEGVGEGVGVGGERGGERGGDRGDEGGWRRCCVDRVCWWDVLIRWIRACGSYVFL